MSNTKKDGDFSLDEELRSKIVANESGQPISDEHEDETEIEVDMCPNDVTVEELHKANVKKYGINAHLKRRPELINSNVLLSVRNLKQFFFFGSGFNRTKLRIKM